ncbi:secretion system protein [Synergistales bacterium]|nr:secretion system protein [Synergistales bacterium]
MNFHYRARLSDGKVVEANIEAENQGKAIESLKTQGMLPLSVNLAGKDGGKPAAAKSNMTFFDKLQRIGTIPAKAKMIFFRQMATMVQAGLSLTMALNIVVEQEKSLIFRDAIASVRGSIDQGITFSNAMKQHPGVFDILMLSLVQAGEEGGMLDSTLNRIANLLEKQQILKGKIKSAMFYPMFILCFAAGVVVVYIGFILPQFKQVFESMGINLPFLTQFMFDLGDYCQENSTMILITIGIIIAALVFLFTNRTVKPMMDKFKLKCPVFGPLVMKSALSRSTQTLASLVKAGVPILRGLEMSSDVADNVVISGGFANLIDATKRGASLGDSARQAGVFPLLVCQMLRIGEETGHLDDMLDKVASWYEQELDEQVKAMTAMLEPVMIVIIGGLVAIIAISIFGPITSAMEQLS